MLYENGLLNLEEIFSGARSSFPVYGFNHTMVETLYVEMRLPYTEQDLADIGQTIEKFWDLLEREGQLRWWEDGLHRIIRKEQESILTQLEAFVEKHYCFPFWDLCNAGIDY